MTDVNEVLKWLVGGGSVAVVSWSVSWFLEGMVWWENISSKLRGLLILLVSALLGVGATYVLSLPPETLEPIMPYLTTGLLVISAWLATQVAHRADYRAKS